MGTNTFSSTNQLEKIQAGFLCYDLQPFTEDCLYRVSQAIAPIRLKAYPVIFHPYQRKSRFPYHPSFSKGRFWGVNAERGTPEGFASNINWPAAWRCVYESDIVFLFGLQGGTALVGGLLASLTRRTLISVNQTLPPEWERKRHWWVRLLKKWLLNRCTLHVYQTPGTKEVLRSVYGIKENIMYFAPFEGGASWFKKTLEKHYNQEEYTRRQLGLADEVIFLFVGNLHPFKGVSDLIKAASRMDKDARFVCVFAGPEEPRNKEGGTIDYYINIARKLRVQQRIRFLGAVDPEKLATIYLAADVVVLPTYKDCFPKVLVEGAIAHKPLITTNACGAVGAMVIDGDNGFVIEPGDINALADVMTKLLDNSMRKKMGSRSGELADIWCNIEAETKAYVEAIKHVLGSRVLDRKI